MATADVIDRYYETANAGEWDAWCDLFTDDMVMDEQLAGHIETLATLRPMMAGMGRAYSKFQNVPKHIVVNGDEAAVVSHISAANAAGDPIEANVMNYFKIRDGKIAYMANFHDSVPFRPVPRPEAGLTRDGDVRPHRHRCRRGGVRRREPPVRGPGREGPAARGRRRRRPAERPRRVDLVHAARLGRRLEVLQRAAGRARRAQDLRAARQAPGRLERLLHHDAHPRPHLGLRRLGRRRRDRLVVRRTACRTSRSWRARRTTRARGPVTTVRCRVTNAGKHDPNPTSQAFIDACLELGYPADRRLQRAEHGRRRLAPHQRGRRQAVRRLPGVPRAGPRAART